MALLCNDVSHWLGANLESALCFRVSVHTSGFHIRCIWIISLVCNTYMNCLVFLNKIAQIKIPTLDFSMMSTTSTSLVSVHLSLMLSWSSLVKLYSAKATSLGWQNWFASTSMPTGSLSSIGVWSEYRYSSNAINVSRVVFGIGIWTETRTQ